jgi:hypothetical protein
MKLSTISTVVLGAVSFLAFGVAIAGPAEISIVDGVCKMINQNKTNLVFTDGVEVSSNNQNGNVSKSCTYQFPSANDPRRAIVYNFDNTDGGICFADGTEETATANWHQVITADGKSKLTCHYHD